MPSLYSYRDSNIRRTYFLLTAFLIFIIGLGFIFSQLYGNYLILIFAVLFSVLMSFASYWYSDKVALAVAGAKEVSREKSPDLYRILENLSIAAGLPTPKIYIVPEAAPNAFATGRDPEHAAIAVTAGLIQKLDKTELEGVLAHELSHVGNRDILLSTVVVVLVGFVSLLANWFFQSMFWGGFRNRENNNNGGLFLLIGIALSVIAPISATLIQLAISRKREMLADASGALLTRYPEGLISALEKISADPTPLKGATEATAHLWLADPFKNRKRAPWYQKLFTTHPPIEERIAALRRTM